MFCQNCGNRLPDNAAFCSKCGSKVNQEESVKQEKVSDSAAQEEKPKQTIVPFLLTGIFVIIAGIVGGIFLFGKKSEDKEVLLADGTVMEDENWQELKPLYDAVDVPVIDIRAVNYTPGTKVPGILWDKTLFYWLEDVDQTSSEDGYLAKCPVSRMLLRSAEDGNLIEYEIYRDPETEEIYKIVSIEQGSQELHLTDYYYQDGNPNFTFSRNDSVYTPTYATTAKRGERYYFNGDVMARWRMIEEPYAIEEYVLTLNDAVYSQYDYFEESAENQKSYDETEVRELNAARNTFDAVTNAGTGVGLVEGYVSDAAGNPLSGMTVDILRENDDVLLYRSVTAEDGSFNIFVYLEDISCRVVVRGNDIYASNSIRGVELSGVTGGNNCELRLHRLGGDEYPVDINVYDAADVRTGEDGSVVKDLLAGAKVFLREGAGVRTGETVRVLDADVNGAIQTTLPAGTYTAQIDVPGYVSAYATVEVAEKETTVEEYMLPVPEAGQTGIVLSWEGEADLDLTLFTPYQSTDGDMAHIGGKSTEDGHGNRLVADNAAGCEVMYVNTGEAGNYKLYVNNYTESEAGNYGSGQFSVLNIHVCIYDSTGLIGEFSFPIGLNGVVWEVADINRNQITPAQRVYSSLEGKRWWTESKWALDMEENTHLKHLMESMVLAAWGNNGYEYFDYSSNAVNSMQAWTDELYRGNWENMGDWLGTAALTYYIYPKTYYIDREDMSYIDEIMTQPDVAKVLQEPDSYGNSREGWLLTKEQLEYLAYAASGIDWNIQSVNDVMNAHPCTGAGEAFIEKIDDRILFRNGEAGMEIWVNLKNIISEYAGAGKWSVSADCIYVDHEISLQMADVTFTVKRNPDSCFDGYSITGMNITPTDNSGWAQAYYDYLRSNAEALNNWFDGYALINIDNDNIPEMVVFGNCEASGNVIINYSDGTVHETQLTRSYFSYIERANLLCNSWGHMDGYGDIVYSIIDGKMTVIAEGRYGAEDNTNVQYDINGNPIYVFEWKGRTVTEAEYGAELRKVYDYDKATEKSSYDYDTYTYDDIVNIIMYLIDN